MKRIAIVGFLTLLVVLPGAIGAQEASKPPAPENWLKQLSGEWEADSELVIGPGVPPMKAKVTEKVRSVGIWMIAENEVKTPDFNVTGIMTVGYDPQRKTFVGTWVDSTNAYLWRYEGKLDPTGEILTLEAEGPNPTLGGKMSKFRDIIEIKSKDHKVFSSALLGEDGKWTTFQTAHARRKK